jgi:hypothetical protein
MTKPTQEQIDEIKDKYFPLGTYLNKDIEDIIKLTWQKAQDEILDEIKDMDFYKILPKGKVWSLNNDTLCEELQKELLKELRNRKDVKA